jgi:acyl carrier protein
LLWLDEKYNAPSISLKYARIRFYWPQEKGINPEEPMSAYGIDSMTATELSMILRSQYNFSVSTVELMTTATCK